MSVIGVLQIISDLERAVSFYTQILDFQEMGRITCSEVLAVEDLAVLEKAVRAQDKCLSLHAVPIKGLENHPKAVLGRAPDGHPLLFLESG
jgi:hypothetical protein